MLRTLHRYWKMANDPRTPKIVKYLVYGALVYTISPIDLLPDFVPGLGLLDEAAILPTVIGLAMILIPKEVKEGHELVERQKTEQKQEEGGRLRGCISGPSSPVWLSQERRQGVRVSGSSGCDQA